MKTRVNKKIIAVTIFGLIAAATVGVVVAYFTNARKLVNKFTVGNNTISITEEFTPPKELKAGLNTYSKKVQITNTGSTDAFIRVYAEFSDSDIADRSFVAASKPSAVSIDAGTSLTDASVRLMDAGYKSHSDFWTKGGPSNDWVYIPATDSDELGGYFYYTKSVAPGDATKDLINTVATYFESADDIKDYEIIVYAESVQTADKDGVAFADDAYEDAWTEFLSRKTVPEN